MYAETTPHHLFLDDSIYSKIEGHAVVNPPLRDKKHHEALFKAIKDGTIDTIGSDHAPHLIAEKARPYGQCPSGMPGIETTLPLLITAYHQGLLTLEDILSLTYKKPKEIFNLPDNDDIVLVDLTTEKTVHGATLKTKCAWSAFEGMTLRGFPRYVVLDGKVFDL